MIPMLLRVLGEDYARPVRRTIALMVAAAVAEGAAYALLVPALVALLGPTPADAWPWLTLFAGAVAGFALLRYVADLAGFTAGTTLLRGTFHRLGDHLAGLPVAWFTPGRVGEVSTLAKSGVLQVMGVIAHLLAPLVSAIVTPLTIVVVMLAFNWQLGLAAVGAAVAVGAVQRWTVPGVVGADAERVRRDQEATGRVIEYLRAQPVLRAGGRTSERFDLLDGSLRELHTASRRTTRAALPGLLGVNLTVQTAFTALLALAAHLALAGDVDAPEVLALLVLAARCADPLLSLSEMGAQLHAARTQLGRLDTVLRAASLPEPTRPVLPVGHDLALSSVSYRRGKRRVIEDLSLKVAEGERLAIVGPSGSGKSTLLHLLARFDDVDGGAVRWGGVDVRAMGTEALLERISIVFQHVYLFDGTIEENIRLGRPDAERGQLRAAASAAGLDEVVERLPDGWSTKVGEGGALLSGGERQRVSIARALLKDTPVVLLDEITAALDPDTAEAVHHGVRRLIAGRTVVMVAHRMSTVRDADRIAFLDAGRILEVGDHDELLRRGGRYAEFWHASTHEPGSAGPAPAPLR